MPNHHAVLLLGSSLKETGYPIEKEKAETEFIFYTYEILAISDVRRLIQAAFVKPFERATKTLVLEVRSIAPEAQQALLKVLEEPPASTKFILVIKSTEGLLPTLLSRLARPLTSDVKVTYSSNPQFTDFLKSDFADRLEYISKITKDKDLQNIELLREGIMCWLLANKKHPVVSVIQWAAMNMALRGASKKMLLEEIALSLPLES